MKIVKNNNKKMKRNIYFSSKYELRKNKKFLLHKVFLLIHNLE